MALNILIIPNYIEETIIYFYLINLKKMIHIKHNLVNYTMAQSIEDKYKKYELREHIYNIPDTYIGSVNNVNLELYLYNDESKKMEIREINYVPGLLKIFDEVIVNAIDHSVRLMQEESAGKENIKHVKNIKVTVDKDTGTISVYNDGNGIDVVMHETLQVYVPELITGTLLTSTNYNHQEEKIIGGKGGYGLKLTNIFSKEFIVETVDHYRQRIFVQHYSNNMLNKDKPSIRSTPKQPYTKITFLPDYARFSLPGMTDDIFQLLKRRTIDAAACTNKNVSVFFNDEKLPVKDFEKYAGLFISSEEPLIYEACNERWEIAVSASNNGVHEQISFANGINTIRGGTHVNYITNTVIKKLSDMIEAKKKKVIKAQTLKDNLFIFVKSTIVNPAFDSQSKETLTTPVAKFGSKCDISDKFIEKLYKTNIVERALSLTEFQNQKKLTKTDGKKTSRLIIPKLDDANLAGTKESATCTLILTEGDSAKTMAISGLSIIGRDKYGVFPLRGKVMNVKDAAVQKISDNAEITALKKILGLEQNKKYNSTDSLRYGSIMILTDQDHDGSHIKGLLFNVFQSLWNSLYKMDGFLTSMLTPIIKATSNKGEVISFYNMSDYERWAASDIAKRGSWKIKYYKGLGTSKDEEAKEYFKNMKKITYTYTDSSDEYIDLAFNKKRADDRKSWLMNYQKDDVLDYTQTSVNYEEFINRDLIHFSNRDLERSINHICDGLKESTRKILFACLKRKLFTNEIKVAQLAGNVSEVTAYHHGEQSLQQAIIGMSQIFVGTNNINLLVPNGQMGSRLQGGADASSPRYVFTLLSELTKLIFKEEDNAVLNYLEEDGQSIEPEYYMPIIPVILANGGLGIGTGFSTNVPQFDPYDIISSCIRICDAITAKQIVNEDVTSMHEVIDAMPLSEFTPWYLGFTGSIEKTDKGTFISKGTHRWIDSDTLEITELPIGIWTEDYKEFLEGLISNNANFLKSVENHYTSKNVKFTLHFNGDIRTKLGDKFETEFKLVSSKNMSINNMHLYNSNGAIKKYENTSYILKEWSLMRITKYDERKKYQIKILEKDHNMLSTKIRFIIDVIEGRIQIMNKKITEISQRLVELKYPKINEINTDDTNDNGYSYLLKMPISQLTYDRKIILEKEVADLADKINELKNTSIEKIWKEELMELLEAWNNHREKIEEEYQNDKNGIVSDNKPKRKPRAPAARKPKA
jgi:DNA topoisomerase-2